MSKYWPFEGKGGESLELIPLFKRVLKLNTFAVFGNVPKLVNTYILFSIYI